MSNIAGSAYCKVCDKPVHVIVEDWGIGSYEYWGAKCVDTQYTPVCEECGNEITGCVDYDEVEQEW